MKCPVCKIDIKQWDLKKQSHLMLTKTVDNHIHVHGNLDDKEDMKELLEAGIQHSEVQRDFMSVGDVSEPPKEVVFRNKQKLGDTLMCTAGIRDFKEAFPGTRVNVVTTAMHVWDNNPHVDCTLVPTKENTVKIGPGHLTNASNRLDWHFANAYRVSMENELKLSIPQGLTKPDIWLTEDEYHAPPVTKDPYWVICIGGEPGWGCKMYPVHKWQEFVNQNPDTLFYQIGAREDVDRLPRLQGKNVVDYVGKTQSRDEGIRDLFKLFLNAEGSIGLVSFHMHLSAAFGFKNIGKPCIVIAGAREPVSFTRYPGHQYLTTEGTLPCSTDGACWHCKTEACRYLVDHKEQPIEQDKQVPACVEIIEPDDITRALNMYYKGGRLKKGIQNDKPRFTNLVKTKHLHVIPKQEIQHQTPQDKQWNLPFGGGSLTDKDWEFMEKTIDEHGVENVLEFGAGLSTLLMMRKGLKVTTYETSKGWIDKIKSFDSTADIRMWKNTDEEKKRFIESLPQFDMAFVDGPAGGGNRNKSTEIASKLADVIIVHDAGRAHEKKWQDMYIKGGFDGPGKGGHRCHVWTRKEETNIIHPEVGTVPGDDLYKEACTDEPKPIDTEHINKLYASPETAPKFENESVVANLFAERKKLVKLVSTARGWGGCARSCTTIMKHMLKAGYDVEFIPFRGKVTSKEYIAMLSDELRDVRVTEDYASLHEHCDVLFVYADDFVWEFKTPLVTDLFANVNADRRVMMLNYRRGDVGTLPWTRGWDKYMFLNSTQEEELLNVHPGVETKVLPPCTELDVFFNVVPKFKDKVKLVRHSSQGGTKYDKENFEPQLENMLKCRPDLEAHLLPDPNIFKKTYENLFFHSRTADPQVIADFLSKGNLFWYSLPPGYMDMGPRVILEAMAAGLPVLADNWGGAKDRVTPQTGWLCDNKGQMEGIVREIELDKLAKMGQFARQRAHDEFKPERWVEEVVGKDQT